MAFCAVAIDETRYQISGVVLEKDIAPVRASLRKLERKSTVVRCRCRADFVTDQRILVVDTVVKKYIVATGPVAIDKTGDKVGCLAAKDQVSSITAKSARERLAVATHQRASRCAARQTNHTGI